MKITNIYNDVQVSKQTIKPVVEQKVVTANSEKPLEMGEEEQLEGVSKGVQSVPKGVSKSVSRTKKETVKKEKTV